jgi:hypothetical protein
VASRRPATHLAILKRISFTGAQITIVATASTAVGRRTRRLPAEGLGAAAARSGRALVGCSEVLGKRVRAGGQHPRVDAISRRAEVP